MSGLAWLGALAHAHGNGRCREAGMSGRMVMANEVVLAGHAVLDIECLDRVYPLTEQG
jgi:hypothetical protein